MIFGIGTDILRVERIAAAYARYGERFSQRILMPEEFTAHPLRKDYPLQGRGERHNFPVIRRGQA